MDICTHFSTNLKFYRVKARLSQGDMADKLECTQQAVSLWEKNLKTPRLNELPRIASVLNTTVAKLLGLEEEIPEEKQ